MISSTAQDAVQRHRSTAFFLGLEKDRWEGCYLQKLRNEEEELVTDLVDIATRVQNFYADFKRTIVITV